MPSIKFVTDKVLRWDFKRLAFLKTGANVPNTHKPLFSACTSINSSGVSGNNITVSARTCIQKKPRSIDTLQFDSDVQYGS